MTILHPERFALSAPPGFDGVFDWDFLIGAFPRGIMPMDWDAVVEIGGRFLVFETKDIGKDVPKGQIGALQQAVATGRFTLLVLWGKQAPVIWERFGRQHYSKAACTTAEVYDFCKAWGEWANAHPIVGQGDSEAMRRELRQVRAALSDTNDRMLRAVRAAKTLVDVLECNDTIPF